MRKKRGKTRDESRSIDSSTTELPEFIAVQRLMMQGEYQESIKFLEDFESQVQDDLDKLRCIMLRGVCLLQIGEFKTSLMLAQQVIDDSKGKSSLEILVIDAQILLATAMSELGRLRESHEICEQIDQKIKTQQEAGLFDLRSQKASFLHIKGHINFLWGKYEESMEVFQESLSLRRELGNAKEIALSMANIAIVSARTHPEEAIELSENGIELMKELNSEEHVDLLLYGISRVYTAKGNL